MDACYFNHAHRDVHTQYVQYIYIRYIFTLVKIYMRGGTQVFTLGKIYMRGGRWLFTLGKIHMRGGTQVFLKTDITPICLC